MFVLLSTVVVLKVVVVRAKKRERGGGEREREREREKEVDSTLFLRKCVLFKLFFLEFQEHLYDKNYFFIGRVRKKKYSLL